MREVGTDLEASETPRIVHDQFSAVVELESPAQPLRLILVRSVEESFDTGLTVEQEHTSHAKAHAERRSVRLEE